MSSYDLLATHARSMVDAYFVNNLIMTVTMTMTVTITVTITVTMIHDTQYCNHLQFLSCTDIMTVTVSRSRPLLSFTIIWVKNIDEHEIVAHVL